MAAWISAERPTRNVLSRMFILNPEAGVGHIALGDLGKENYLTAPKDAAAETVCAGAVQKRLAALVGTFGAVLEFKAPVWRPSTQESSSRFVGRLLEMWSVHTGLDPWGISEHENPHTIVQLRGLGGVGKSLIAVEYAKRFGARYPGGIHWLRAYGFDSHKPLDAVARERERRSQIENLAAGYKTRFRIETSA